MSVETTIERPETVERTAHTPFAPATCYTPKIINSDNCEAMRLMDSESVDLVVTSPPYGNLRQYGGHGWDFYGVAWNLTRLLKPGGVIVWIVNDATEDGSETGTSMEQCLHFKRLGLRLHDTMIYRKTNKPPLNHPRYEQEWEYAFVLSKAYSHSCGKA